MKRALRTALGLGMLAAAGLAWSQASYVYVGNSRAIADQSEMYYAEPQSYGAANAHLVRHPTPLPRGYLWNDFCAEREYDIYGYRQAQQAMMPACRADVFGALQSMFERNGHGRQPYSGACSNEQCAVLGQTVGTGVNRDSGVQYSPPLQVPTPPVEVPPKPIVEPTPLQLSAPRQTPRPAPKQPVIDLSPTPPRTNDAGSPRVNSSPPPVIRPVPANAPPNVPPSAPRNVIPPPPAPARESKSSRRNEPSPTIVALRDCIDTR